MTNSATVNVAGATLRDQQLWHTYFYWPRAALSPKSRLPQTSEFRRLPVSMSRHLQAVVFAAFALEYRIKRYCDVLNVSYGKRETLGDLLKNFRGRVESTTRLDGKGPVQLPAEWDSLQKKLKELVRLRNKIAHANYHEVLQNLPADPRQSRAKSRSYYNNLVDAMRVISLAIGYETLTAREAVRYYARLKVR